MKYEDFEKFIKEKCMYDTIYDDSNGRQVLIIQMLDAYGMVDKALRARLAQPEPAECDGGQCGIGGYCKECPKTQPDGVGLTDEEVDDIGCDFATLDGDIDAKDWFAFYLAIEAKLREKNT